MDTLRAPGEQQSQSEPGAEERECQNSVINRYEDPLPVIGGEAEWIERNVLHQPETHQGEPTK
jgi:hypothetical protein